MTFVKFHTNLDDYRSFHFPDLEIIPRIGEAVSVCDGFIYYFEVKTYHHDLRLLMSRIGKMMFWLSYGTGQLITK